ncbi:hypothetical protein [Nocardia otitidiscaviarum]|uniref:hypothetical protein n=1 Tax=Nocardia otitidiscaviarum TaxID=1823 RepID=UPI0011C02716|nr:hypothetical protein [Nocardia otitidiscaviarum]
MTGSRLPEFFKGVADGLRSQQIPRIAEYIERSYGGPLGANGLRTVSGGAGDADALAAEQVKHPIEGTGQAVPPAPLLSPHDVENSLTNLAMFSADRLRAFGPGSGFSGVYHPGTRKMLAYPSGDTTRLDIPGEPTNLVSRYGGHVDVEDKLLQAINRDYGESVGFSAVLREDGSLGCRWTSRSVNGENRSFDGPFVPEDLRPEIMRTLHEITGRKVESDV